MEDNLATYFNVIKTEGTSTNIWVSGPENGHNPGLIICYPISTAESEIEQNGHFYAEEGYTCLSVTSDNLETDDFVSLAVNTLLNIPEHSGGISTICFGDTTGLAAEFAKKDEVKGVICYGKICSKALAKLRDKKTPCLLHLPEKEEKSSQINKSLEKEKYLTAYLYPDCRENFYAKLSNHFNKAATMIAHSRDLHLLRTTIGPIYDLVALWELHTQYEFNERDVDATMKTMVAQPYVNHIPTMTGGVGFENLRKFYSNFFINSNPPDTKLIPVSRTIGIDRLVDEMIFSFTHTTEVPWMLPSVKPTGKFVEVPLVAIVNFRGDKLYNEHIYWDQASVLVQIGLLQSDGLPVTGSEAAKKLLDPTLPSNQLMGKSWIDG
jgi:carboxymethylenebutenolidase|tara:strand:+ start:378 stop:1514 length:1137 start_codon:yes stop_codon:yes gene_type:complete